MRSPISTPDLTDLPDQTAPTSRAVDATALVQNLTAANRSLSTVASMGAEHDRAVLGASMAMARLSKALESIVP
jgi:hypothetical protein